MPRIALTSGFVRAAGCPVGRAKVDFFDTNQRGLMLEVRASGGKTFYQRYTDDHGRERQFKNITSNSRALFWANSARYSRR